MLHGDAELAAMNQLLIVQVLWYSNPTQENCCWDGEVCWIMVVVISNYPMWLIKYRVGLCAGHHSEGEVDCKCGYGLFSGGSQLCSHHRDVHLALTMLNFRYQMSS